MQRVNEYRFYTLGAAMERLRSLEKSTLYRDCIAGGWVARRNLRALLDDPVSLKVCRPAIEKILDAISKFLPEDPFEIIGDKEFGEKEVGFLAYTIQEGLKELDTVLDAECRTLDTYAVSQKGAYSTSDLIDRAEIMIPEETRNNLEDAVIKDIREAGRCLVFDLPTAAGFHVLRAIELVMADCLKKKNAGQKKPTNWGQYIEQLKKAGVASRITSMLENIKNLYRNPIAHPEDTLTDSDALVLFGLGIAAIQQMGDPGTHNVGPEHRALEVTT